MPNVKAGYDVCGAEGPPDPAGFRRTCYRKAGHPGTHSARGVPTFYWRDTPLEPDPEGDRIRGGARPHARRT